MIKFQTQNLNGKISKQTKAGNISAGKFDQALLPQAPDKVSFQGGIVYKSESKIRKIFAKIIGEVVEASENGFERVAYINRHGRKASELTCYPGGNKERVTIFEKDGKTIKERQTYEKLPSGKMEIKKAIQYRNGKEFCRYEISPEMLYTKTEKLTSGEYAVEVGSIGKEGEPIPINRAIYPADENTAVKKEKTFRDYCTEGVSLTVKVKDIEELKQTHAQAVKEKGLKRAGILVIENPYFETYRSEADKMPFGRWAAKNISQKFGEEVPFPDGDNPEDVLNAYILKDKYLKTHYKKAFNSRRINWAFNRNIKFAVEKYWELVENSWRKLDNIMEDSPKDPRNDVHFNAAADFLKMEVRNEQSHSVFQEILGNYAIKHFEYKPKAKKA